MKDDTEGGVFLLSIFLLWYIEYKFTKYLQDKSLAHYFYSVASLGGVQC